MAVAFLSQPLLSMGILSVPNHTVPRSSSRRVLWRRAGRVREDGHRRQGLLSSDRRMARKAWTMHRAAVFTRKSDAADPHARSTQPPTLHAGMARIGRTNHPFRWLRNDRTRVQGVLRLVVIVGHLRYVRRALYARSNCFTRPPRSVASPVSVHRPSDTQPAGHSQLPNSRGKRLSAIAALVYRSSNNGR